MSAKKRMQIFLSEEALAIVAGVVEKANADFEEGSISFSDAVNELVLNGKVDIKLLQSKHTDIRRSLRLLAAKDDIDLENVIRTLQDLKTRTAGGRKARPAAEATANG